MSKSLRKLCVCVPGQFAYTLCYLIEKHQGSSDMSTIEVYARYVLTYWFGENENDMDMWFHNGERYDIDITRRFEHVLRICSSPGQLQQWARSLEGFLAYIVVTDQFSRHIRRGTPGAYAQDYLARDMVYQYLPHYIDRLHGYELMFATMPLQHSEDLEDQFYGVRILSTRYRKSIPRQESEIIRLALEHHIGHLRVIAMFGRFPKRNHTLRRPTTPEEQRYINDSKQVPY